ncbi:DUF2207 domain-containing protein [Serratia sp. S1B]|nr:DUF2207 domain-containing protein [Serratia sp. S1B]
MAGWCCQLLYGFCLLWSLTIGPALATNTAGLAPPESIQTPDNASKSDAPYEHILSFDAHAHFNPDGSMAMQEDIKVQALGQQIRRGIFRTLPLGWNRQDGKNFSVDYQIIQVLRNGVPEPYSLDRTNDTLTVRIGRAEQLLSPGIYNYQIQYQVSNHFSRFPDWDELYWNVTGNGWAYPIDSASFHLELPAASDYLDNKGRDSRLRTIDVYTGVKGEKQHNAHILPDGSVITSQPLAQGEGLTVVYTWPRSILATVPAPQARSPWVHILLPSLTTSILWLPVLLLAAYCLSWWRRNSAIRGLKMPPIVPLFELPATLSPGYLRYITQRNYDDIAFSSDLLSLVAKQAIAITPQESQSAESVCFKSSPSSEQWLSLLPNDHNEQLNAHDRQLLQTLFADNQKSISLNVAYQPAMQNARTWLAERCEQQKPEPFNKLGKPVRRAIYLLLLFPLVSGLLFTPYMALLTLLSFAFLLIGLIFISMSLASLFNLRSIVSNRGISIYLSTFGGLIFLFGGGLGMFGMLSFPEYPDGYIGALLVSIIICLIFFWVIPSYTQQGLNDLAVAKGLKRYLGAAEKYRYQSLYPPDQLVSHFERLLPVALALGVGKTWANTFAQYMSTTGATSAVFGDSDWDSFHHFSQSCSSSSSPTPSSSSDSGSGSSDGGSSGGGSGGGGGGGW